MARVRKQEGFSLIELMIVVAIALVIAGFAVPAFMQTLRNFRIAGDARSMNGELLTAKMRAAARFTRTRVQFVRATRQFRSQWWDKTLNGGAGGWADEAVGAPQVLSEGVTFGDGGVANNPEGNPIGFADPCLDDGGVPIAGTACIVFNSRGFPIDATLLSPLSSEVYVTDVSQVHGVLVSVTGLTRVWRTDTVDTEGANWIRH
ncbi:MAG: prepilin-type N-terminal cleavage/methylation domain-containing protein [Acidobacteria bacterium]|nr:prepilin-type N-terminal cleavage/methylation domain-containing protein [Acidobacteriota bacterium]